MEIQNVTVKFEEKLVLDGFSLEIPESGVLCLFGPSGCGKTTLLRVIAGLQAPTGGELSCQPTVAAVFQEDRLLPWLSIQKNITSAAGVSRETADLWLRRVGLETEKKQLPRNLSGGMQRRVAMARALAAKSDILLLDEPFNGVDEETKKLLYPLILEAAENKPVILVTHHRQEAEALGAKILELTGPPLKIKTLP